MAHVDPFVAKCLVFGMWYLPFKATTVDVCTALCLNLAQTAHNLLPTTVQVTICLSYFNMISSKSISEFGVLFMRSKNFFAQFDLNHVL